MRRFVDFHTHSSASDGDAAPDELVRLAEAKRLRAIALTDHDTIGGLASAAAAARGLTVRLVSGIEISARWPEGTLHIVALGFDPWNATLRGMLQALWAARKERNPRIVRRLREQGIDISMDEVKRFAAGRAGAATGFVGRLQIAQVLVRKGCARDVGDAFARYVGMGGSAYVDKERLAPAQAFAGIRAAGGVSVLAHPPQLNYGNLARLRQIAGDLREQGLDGIEAYHPDHSPQETRHYLDLARAIGLLVSGGSDFHGQGKPDVRLGCPAVPVEAVQPLLARLGL